MASTRSIDIAKAIKEPDKRRFWRFVRIGDPGECWEWTGSKKPSGYGRFSSGGHNGVTLIASRVAYFAAYRTLDERFVCHSCDNPSCCNPAHLFLGTNSDNQKDSHRKGRHKSDGEDNPNAKLSASQVLRIRQMLAAGEEQRHIARVFRVSQVNVSLIKRRLAWAWLP
jgi:hypothetical protein